MNRKVLQYVTGGIDYDMVAAMMNKAYDAGLAQESWIHNRVDTNAVQTKREVLVLAAAYIIGVLNLPIKYKKWSADAIEKGVDIRLATSQGTELKYQFQFKGKQKKGKEATLVVYTPNEKIAVAEFLKSMHFERLLKDWPERALKLSISQLELIQTALDNLDSKR